MYEHPDFIEMTMHEHLEDLHELADGRRPTKASPPDHRGIGHALAVPAHVLAAPARALSELLHHHAAKPAVDAAENVAAANTAAADAAQTGAFPGPAAPAGGQLPMPH